MQKGLKTNQQGNKTLENTKATVQILEPHLLLCFAWLYILLLWFPRKWINNFAYVLIPPVFNGVRESLISKLIRCQSNVLRCQWSHAWNFTTVWSRFSPRARVVFLNLLLMHVSRFFFFLFFYSDTTVCHYLCANIRFSSRTQGFLMALGENI